MIRHFKYFDDETYEKLEDLDVRTIDLVYFQLSGTLSPHPNVKYWKEFFLTGNVTDSAPDYLKNASQEIRFVNLSQEEKMMAEMMSKREADYWAHITSAEDRGREEKQIEVIHEFYNNGVTINVIAKSLHISTDEVRDILDLD